MNPYVYDKLFSILNIKENMKKGFTEARKEIIWIFLAY
jgi:hypothetical protein